MKKFVVVGLVVAMISSVGYFEQHYSRKGCKVVNVNDNVITVKDKAGYIWKFEGEGYAEGDIVTLKMYSKATISDITDDEIIKVIKVDK